MSTETESCCCANEAEECCARESECCGCSCESGKCHFGLAGWFTIGMAVAALGVYAAKELRSRYKFNRRTPYDFYSKAGKREVDEFGMGI